MFVVIDDMQGYWKKSKGWSEDLDEAESWTAPSDIPRTLINLWQSQYNSNVYILNYDKAQKYAYNTKLESAQSIHDLI